ncbi:Spx/MgsR family RNA polymerase-binding regulatory protein [Salinisphaera orenii]|uniref:Spx/MgsR family RNA polymerase-binding regulatory protein n=1 Tax=Salinisphaera orenii TaxID=856731 RepID=UPI000DBE846B
MIRLYGIGNCDTCRKARRWLSSAGIDFEWQDFDRHSVEVETVARWLDTAGLETLLNKQSKAWRELTDDQRAAVTASPASAMAQQVRLIKRPVLETSNAVIAGFSTARYAALFDA